MFGGGSDTWGVSGMHEGLLVHGSGRCSLEGVRIWCYGHERGLCGRWEAGLWGAWEVTRGGAYDVTRG